MIACYDMDGTINADPEFYRCEMRGLMDAGHQVHVLTGNVHAEHQLAQHGLVRGRDFSHLAVVPEKHIAAVKAAYMQHVGATHLIDNNKQNIKDARKAGITAHWHRPPKEN